MQMSQEVAEYGDYGAEDLDGDVEAGFDYSQHHAGGEDDAEGEGLEEDVCP